MTTYAITEYGTRVDHAATYADAVDRLRIAKRINPRAADHIEIVEILDESEQRAKDEATYTALQDAARALNEFAGYTHGASEKGTFRNLAITVGYIGNVERWGDERVWMFFHPVPGADGYSNSWGRGTPEQLLAAFRARTDSAKKWAKTAQGGNNG